MESLKREMRLEAETAALRATMTAQQTEIQMKLQIQQLEKHIEQQGALIAESNHDIIFKKKKFFFFKKHPIFIF